jgi:hypothetical protein
VAALSAMSPAPALADSCRTSIIGCYSPGSCTNATAFCQSLQPGCTVTNSYCLTVFPPEAACGGTYADYVDCSYAP